jgi:hypothetical protein
MKAGQKGTLSRNHPAQRLEGVVWNQLERESKVTFFPSPGKLPDIEEFVRDRWVKNLPWQTRQGGAHVRRPHYGVSFYLRFR